MESDIQAKLKELDEKVTQIYVSVEKTRKYFLTIIWISVIAFVLPLVGLLFAIPTFISSYSSMMTGL